MNRILGVAERQEAHRHSLESASVLGNLRAQATGQYIAGTVVVVGMGIGALLVSTGREIAGFTAMLTPLGTVAALFLIGKAKQASERRQKLEEVDRPPK